jgi:hypothetical protein
LGFKYVIVLVGLFNGSYARFYGIHWILLGIKRAFQDFRQAVSVSIFDLSDTV